VATIGAIGWVDIFAIDMLASLFLIYITNILRYLP
jgi:hypothetical protein